MSNVLVAEKLCKSFSEAKFSLDVLSNLDLTVTKGELVALVGASGSGKTTLLQLLGGLDKPTSGKVFVGEKEMTLLSDKEKGELRNHHLGFVYQFHHLMPEFNALENVCMPLLIRGEKPKQIKAKAEHYIEQVGLKERVSHRIGELSGGERQRIAIARALITEPMCVLADEPTGNLDEKTAQQVLELLLQLNESLSTSFVVVTHNLALAAKLHRTLVLENGQLHLKT